MKNKESINRRALKAGLWYTVSNVLVRGINFLATPIFARLMTKTEYGLFSNFATWLSLLTILTTLELSVTVLNAKYDYRERLDQYISSIQCLGTFFTGGCFLVVYAFPNFFQGLFGIDMANIRLMFLYLLVEPAYTLLRTKYNAEMNYKAVIMLTAGSTLTTLLGSLVLVLSMEDKFLGRVLGNTFVMFFFCLALYVHNMFLGKCVHIEYWRYALAIAIPYIPHVLAGNILGTADKIVIIKYCGATANALYSLAYSISLLVTLLASSINQAWAPWLYEKISVHAYDEIRQATNKYLRLTLPIYFLLCLIGPELVLLFGGQAYMESVKLVPCIMAGCYMVMMYSFFVNVEFYHHKTLRISFNTIIAGIANFLSNMMFVPRYGYAAAAYTTLGSYILLLLLHYQEAGKLKASEFFELRNFLFSGIAVLVLMVSTILLYDMPIGRMVVIAGIMIFSGDFLYRKRGLIIAFIKGRS